jgi:hypothetical protein
MATPCHACYTHGALLLAALQTYAYLVPIIVSTLGLTLRLRL